MISYPKRDRQIIHTIFQKIEHNIIVSSIRSGLIMAIPILMIGSISIVINSFADMLYQYYPISFIELIIYICSLIYDATFGIFSLYIVNFISIHYMQESMKNTEYLYGAPIASTAGFIILNGGLSNGISIEYFGVKALITAITAALIATFLYRVLYHCFQKIKLYTEGGDINFNRGITSILPIAATILLLCLFNFMIVTLFHVSSYQSLFINATNALFHNMNRSLSSGLLFVFLSSFLWFFGIHGSDLLEHVSTGLFEPGIQLNITAIQNNQVPTEIFTKTFFDVFIFIGGCGSLFSLLIAILLFSKRGINRYVGKISTLPMIFNVNELLVFGFPVVLNPVFILPFLLTPIIFTITSALAMYIGLVPLTIQTVNWTTPIFFNGYLATNSWTGCILQLFNLSIGVLLYYPFLKHYDKSRLDYSRQKLSALIKLLQEAEENNVSITLTSLENESGMLAKSIAMDLKESLLNQKLELYYQPQFDQNANCIGAEALLRWNHPLYGMIYPPLVIKLADEIGILAKLECYIFSSALKDAEVFEATYKKNLKFSINVSAKTLIEPFFETFLQSFINKNTVSSSNICIEVTEQMALHFDNVLKQRLEHIRKMGFLLAIDDFSMGNTSLKYLQSNQFDIVKLDGCLIQTLDHNIHSKEIISSIVYLSKSLGFSVLAEFVETKEQQKTLEEIGCTKYQGYLYSKAVPYSEFCSVVTTKK